MPLPTKGTPTSPFKYDDPDDEFRPQLLGLLEQRRVVLHHDLREAVAVADVEEDQRAQVAHLLGCLQGSDLILQACTSFHKHN